MGSQGQQGQQGQQDSRTTRIARTSWRIGKFSIGELPPPPPDVVIGTAREQIGGPVGNLTGNDPNATTSEGEEANKERATKPNRVDRQADKTIRKLLRAMDKTSAVVEAKVPTGLKVPRLAKRCPPICRDALAEYIFNSQMIKCLLFALAVGILAPVVWAQVTPTKVIVYPLEAVIDSGTMTKSQFKKQYPGIDVTDFGLTDEGWYIRYSHQKLVYMFGPSNDLEYSRELKAVLEDIRLSAVLKEPKLSSSKIEIVEFKFSARLILDASSPHETSLAYPPLHFSFLRTTLKWE